VDLMTLPHHCTDPLAVYKPRVCVGAYVLNNETGQVVPIIARQTILATGGLGQIYLHTTNPKGARGDGIAMAYRAGAEIINAESVQVHPSVLPPECKPISDFRISSWRRGAPAHDRRP
jgi:L-aspartate oxidase